ncbi:MAG TPA: PAS domain S-box protein, partial [Blastocatellia bacterium]|nr:PAS domain S-box protein [Blastocatellia bacterium]
MKTGTPTVHRNKIRVLLIDDDEDDYVITRDLLEDSPESEFELGWVSAYGAGLDAILKSEHDVYLLDYSLGEHSGLDLLREVSRRDLRAPIILLTGQGDHEVDLDAMKAGAADYLVKGQIGGPLLERSIRYAIERTKTLAAVRNSEEQYRLLFRTNPVPMWVYQVSTLAFLSVNNAAIRCYGFSEQEFLSMRVVDILCEKEMTGSLDDLSTGVPENGIVRITRHRKKDGTIIDVEAIAHDVPIGEATARLVMASDITERKRAEQALRDSEEYFRSLIENALDLINIIDTDGRILYQSPSCERVMGYSPSELAGKSLYDFVHSGDLEIVSAAISKIRMNPGSAEAFEFRFKHGNGLWRTLDAIGQIPATGYGVRGIVVNSRDVTLRQELQDQLVQSEKLAALGKLVSGVAHELNNPLTAMLGYTQLMLLQPDLQAGLSERLEIVHTQAERARQIVLNLLAFARQHKPNKTSVDVNAVLDQTLEQRSYELGRANIVVMRKISLLPEITADSHLLQQAFMNILINAEQSMFEANHRGKLLVKTETIEQEHLPFIRVTISDDGPGIPAHIISKIFDPFFTTRDVGAGTGLGLSISYGIVKEYGGSISVESTLGKGASFKVLL